MRILTVRQPWAWAIIHGGKDVENRIRSLGPYRGPVAIHVGLAMALDAAALWPAGIPLPLGQYARETGGTRGHIIGVVDLVGAHTADECWRKPWKWETKDPVMGDYCSPWAMDDHHHLVLANPRPLPRPIPATGRLGLWRPDNALLTAITEQIEVAA